MHKSPDSASLSAASSRMHPELAMCLRTADHARQCVFSHASQHETVANRMCVQASAYCVAAAGGVSPGKGRKQLGEDRSCDFWLIECHMSPLAQHMRGEQRELMLSRSADAVDHEDLHAVGPLLSPSQVDMVNAGAKCTRGRFGPRNLQHSMPCRRDGCILNSSPDSESLAFSWV